MLLLALAGVISAGCSTATSDQVDVRGRVTYGGAPVPKGRIDFVPAPGAGTSSSGYAIIANGEFNTRSNGVGPSPGTYVARINGFDGNVAAAEESSYGAPLFSNYETELSLSPDQQELVIEVPKQRSR